MRGGFPDTLLDDPDTPLGHHKVGDDVYFFVSGSANSMVKDSSSWTANGDQGTFLVGGDLFVSGNVVISGDFPAAAGGWTVSSPVVRLTAPTDRVGMGTGAGVLPVGKAELSTSGDTTLVITADTASSGSILFRKTTRKAALVHDVDENFVLVNSGTGDDIIFKATNNAGQTEDWLHFRSRDSTLRITGSRVDISWDPQNPSNDEGPKLRLTSNDGLVGLNGQLGTIEFFGTNDTVAQDTGLGAKVVANATATWSTVGSNDNPTELQFWTCDDGTTNPIEQRMVIGSDGRIGMGTSVPSGTLDVKGDGLTSQIFLLSGSGGKTSPTEKGYEDMNFFVSGTIGAKGTSIKGTALFGGDLQVSGTIYGTIAGGTAAGGWVDDGTVVRLVTATDKVGIGTNLPISKLHVFDTSSNGATIRIDSATNSSGSIAFAEQGSATKAALVYEASTDNIILVNSGTDNDMIFKTSPGGIATEWLRYTSADQILHITGSLVEIGWDPNTAATQDGTVLRLSSNHNTCLLYTSDAADE